MDIIEKIEQEVSKRIPKLRFDHSKRVAEMAEMLYRQWGGNREKLIIAGLLHDVARDIPGDKLMEIAQNNGYKIDEIEFQNPILLHAPVGAIIARKDFGISDEEILNCIRYHTTGRKGITINESIIYVSDFIEMGRTFPDAIAVRKIAFSNLKEAVLEETRFNICYLMKERIPVHPRTIEMFNDLLKKN
jgi:predicted HD superfamily hydrolase involved in NAD metabolism